jgi:hypothetical protein
VSYRQPSKRAILIHYVNRAPVGDLGHCQAGHVGQSRLVFKGAGQLLVRLRQECGPTAGFLDLRQGTVASLGQSNGSQLGVAQDGIHPGND